MPQVNPKMTSSGLPVLAQHSFARVPNVVKPRSVFDRSKKYKTTIPAGYWVPVYLDEVLPGDTFEVNAGMFARLLSPLSVPIMDNLIMDWIAIYCPNRLVWENFTAQMGEQPYSTSDITDYTTPVVTVPADGFTSGSLADYFGLPLGVGGVGSGVPLTVSALPFRMYNLFYNQWVRAQNVVTGAALLFDNGPDAYTNYNLLHRMKRPDYFTSSQPQTQKGAPVTLPIGTTAPLVFPNSGTANLGGSTQYVYDLSHSANLGPLTADHTTGFLEGTSLPSATAQARIASDTSGDSTWPVNVDPMATSYANLAAATGITINEFRLLATTQQFLELDERGGTRYPEFLMNHFGVQSSDSRLQRVEYLGAGSIPLITHVVPQTSETATTAQGNLAGFMNASGGCQFTRSFEEHGHIMVLVEIRADITYQQGLQKMWSRQTQLEYYDPIFANIGEQPVFNQEIYAQGTSADAGIFGYQEYSAEYRFGFSQVTGLMREGVTGSVAVYNLAQYYTSLPTLSASWLYDEPDIARISAVEDQDVFIFDSDWHIKSTRVMPVVSIPGITRI